MKIKFYQFWNGFEHLNTYSTKQSKQNQTVFISMIDLKPEQMIVKNVDYVIDHREYQTTKITRINDLQQQQKLNLNTQNQTTSSFNYTQKIHNNQNPNKAYNNLQSMLWISQPISLNQYIRQSQPLKTEEQKINSVKQELKNEFPFCSSSFDNTIQNEIDIRYLYLPPLTEYIRCLKQNINQQSLLSTSSWTSSSLNQSSSSLNNSSTPQIPTKIQAQLSQRHENMYIIAKMLSSSMVYEFSSKYIRFDHSLSQSTHNIIENYLNINKNLKLNLNHHHLSNNSDKDDNTHINNHKQHNFNNQNYKQTHLNKFNYIDKFSNFILQRNKSKWVNIIQQTQQLFQYSYSDHKNQQYQSTIRRLKQLVSKNNYSNQTKNRTSQSSKSLYVVIKSTSVKQHQIYKIKLSKDTSRNNFSFNSSSLCSSQSGCSSNASELVMQIQSGKVITINSMKSNNNNNMNELIFETLKLLKISQEWFKQKINQQSNCVNDILSETIEQKSDQQDNQSQSNNLLIKIEIQQRQTQQRQTQQRQTQQNEDKQIEQSKNNKNVLKYFQYQINLVQSLIQNFSHLQFIHNFNYLYKLLFTHSCGELTHNCGNKSSRIEMDKTLDFNLNNSERSNINNQNKVNKLQDIGQQRCVRLNINKQNIQKSSLQYILITKLKQKLIKQQIIKIGPHDQSFNKQISLKHLFNIEDLLYSSYLNNQCGLYDNNSVLTQNNSLLIKNNQLISFDLLQQLQRIICQLLVEEGLLQNGNKLKLKDNVSLCIVNTIRERINQFKLLHIQLLIKNQTQLFIKQYNQKQISQTQIKQISHQQINSRNEQLDHHYKINNQIYHKLSQSINPQTTKNTHQTTKSCPQTIKTLNNQIINPTKLNQTSSLYQHLTQKIKNIFDNQTLSTIPLILSSPFVTCYPLQINHLQTTNQSHLHTITQLKTTINNLSLQLQQKQQLITDQQNKIKFHKQQQIFHQQVLQQLNNTQHKLSQQIEQKRMLKVDLQCNRIEIIKLNDQIQINIMKQKRNKQQKYNFIQAISHLTKENLHYISLSQERLNKINQLNHKLVKLKSLQIQYNNVNQLNNHIIRQNESMKSSKQQLQLRWSQLVNVEVMKFNMVLKQNYQMVQKIMRQRQQLKQQLKQTQMKLNRKDQDLKITKTQIMHIKQNYINFNNNRKINHQIGQNNHYYNHSKSQHKIPLNNGPEKDSSEFSSKQNFIDNHKITISHTNRVIDKQKHQIDKQKHNSFIDSLQTNQNQTKKRSILSQVN